MRKRYLFFDYDGTLRSRAQDKIPDSAREALKALSDNGHFVSVATGRLQADALARMSREGITSLVADGGHSITIDGELKWMRGLDLDACKVLLHHFDEIGQPWAVTVKNEMIRYTPSRAYYDGLLDDYALTVYKPELRIDDLTTIYKMFIPCPRGKEQGMDFMGVPWARYSPESIFFEPTCKDVGIRKMMDWFGAPYEDAIVFGDGTNDIAMFGCEWESVAMGNAWQPLKDRATYVTTHIDEDGIWNACKHLGLI
ncbi:MAG: HAD hydrolase family protein [Coriobacteriia bacterium]|nr:HAD hydrolase family protein [Coriobacteriia bacterium]